MDGLILTKAETAIYTQAVMMLEMYGIPVDVGYVVMKNVCSRMCDSAYINAIKTIEKISEQKKESEDDTTQNESIDNSQDVS